MTTKQYPSTVEVPTVQPSQLPNLPGNGGITVTNDDPQYSADLSNYQTFPSNQTQTLGPHQSTIFGEGQPVWARVTPGQAGNPTSVELSVYPGSPSAPQGAVDIANEVTVNGTVDVGTISGTVDANITNASIPVSGSVDANITNATLQIAGTVDIAAGQVVEVTNESGGSLTVAGTVDISSVGGTVTVDANGSDVTVDAVGVGTIVKTLPSGATSVSVTVGSGVNSLVMSPVPIEITVQVSTATPGTTVYLPNSTVINSDGTKTVVVQIPFAGTYTVTLTAVSALDVYISTNTGIEDVRASLASPIVQMGSSYLVPQILAVTQNVNADAGEIVSGSTSYTWDLMTDSGTLIIWVDSTVTSVTDSAGAVWAYRLVAIGNGTYVYAIPIAPAGYNATQLTIDFASALGAAGRFLHVQGTPFLPKLPVQTISVPNPAAGAQWSYTLAYPAKLRHIGAVFTTSATAANRYPYVSIGLGHGNSFDALPNGSPLTASAAVNLSWQAGSPSVPFNSPGANGWLASIPDYGVLPTGTVISSGVSGMQSTDQWSNVNLQLEPA